MTAQRDVRLSDGWTATAGRDERLRFAAVEEFAPESFTDADWAALSGDWASLGSDAQQAGAAGPDGLVDDDVAFVLPWGFDLAAIAAPVLLVQGRADRLVPPAHADWMLGRLADAELWRRSADGHVSVLDACPLAMDWLAERAFRGVHVSEK